MTKTETGSAQLVLWTREELKELAGPGWIVENSSARERVLVPVQETLDCKQETAPAGT